MNAIPLVRFGLLWLGVCLLANSNLRADRDDPPRSTPATEIRAEADDDLVSGKGVPDWFVENGAGADGMLYVRTSTHCMNVFQAEEELGRESLLAVNRVLDDWFGEAGAAKKIGLDEDYVLQELVVDGRKDIRIDDDPEIENLHRQYNISTDGNYYCGFVQLHLGEDVRQFARQQWREVETRERLIGSSLIGGSVLILLAIAFAYLKLESATRGFYSRRLQTVAILLIVFTAIAILWARQLLVWPGN